MNRIRQETSPRYVMSEFIQLPSLLTIWGSLGKKLLKERGSELELEDWLKLVLKWMRLFFRIWTIFCFVGKRIIS